MYAIVWVPEPTAAGATSTAQAVKIEDYLEHEIGGDGTLTVHCVKGNEFVPAPRPDGRIPTVGLARGRTTAFAAGGWVLFELFGADGTRFKTRRPPQG